MDRKTFAAMATAASTESATPNQAKGASYERPGRLAATLRAKRGRTNGKLDAMDARSKKPEALY
jgi:hypothetical protein